MIRLLNAGFTRLRKNKLFWLLTIFSIGLAILMIYAGYSDMKKYEEVIEVEQLMLNYSTMIGIVVAIFTSLFLGVEYSDGAIRNKISIGHKRINIYLSNLIIVTITSLFSYILFLVVVASIGIPLFGTITISLSKLLMLLGCIFVTVIAYSSIFTFTAMLISNKTITAITTIMLAFGMMLYSIMAFDRLSQPEYIDTMIMKDGVQEIINTKNNHYLEGEKRKLIQLSIDIVPAGQMFQIAGRTAPNLKVLPLYSLGIIVVFTGAGLVLFKKKELKVIIMSIWFYLFLIVLCLSIFLILKIIIMKNEINNIGKSISSIINTDTNNLITISTNDNELKKLANVLNKSLKNLRQLELEYKNGNQELKSSITNISHDLRTPLTAIRGYLDLMDNNNLTEKQTKYLKIIDSKVNDLTELTEQLFDFSKSIDMQNEIKKENICINDILEDSIASFYSLFKEHSITPNIDICKGKVIRLLNENMLKRIFENIISNAIKYSERDFKVKLFDDGTIEFSNKTDKLDQVSLEKIFDRYYTVRNAKKSNGIGLSIAKQLVDLSNGRIEAKYKKNCLIIKIKFLDIVER